MFTLVDIKFTAIATMIVCFLKSSDAVTGCKLESTAKDIFTIVGKTTKLEWKFEVDVADNPNALVQLQQPHYGVLYAVVIKTNILFPNDRLKMKPFSNHITWTGNVSDNTASFMFSNVTHNLSLPYNVNLLNCAASGQITRTVILHVIEPPSQPQIFCTSGEVTSNRIAVKEGGKLNCSCSGTGGIPAPDVYWTFPGKEKNSSKLFRNGILKNENGTYTCIALNKAGDKRTKLEVDVQYLELTCDVSLRDDNKVVFKTKAIGNPEVFCHPLSCINETIVTKHNVNQTQFANNSVGSDSCNKTVLIDKKLKCGFSSNKEIGYVLVLDEENTNFLLFLKKTPDMIDFIRLDLNLSAKGKELFWPNNTKYVLEKETNNTIRNYFESLCSGGSGILMAPTLIFFLFLGFLLVINE